MLLWGVHVLNLNPIKGIKLSSLLVNFILYTYTQNFCQKSCHLNNSYDVYKISIFILLGLDNLRVDNDSGKYMLGMVLNSEKYFKRKLILNNHLNGCFSICLNTCNKCIDIQHLHLFSLIFLMGKIEPLLLKREKLLSYNYVKYS